MVIKYHISPYPSLLENMLVRIYEAQSPEAVVYEQTLPQPHNAPVTITVPGLDKVVHIVRLYTASSAALLHEYHLEPTTDLLTAFDPIRFKIGDLQPLTPAAGTREYTNPILDSLTDNEFEIVRNNYGTLHPVLHYTNKNGFGGGFALIAPDQFNDLEEFTIHRKPIANTNVSDSVVGKWFAGFIDIDSDKLYEPSHLRKLLRFKGGFNYTFSANAAPPIGYAMCFQNYNNSLQNGRITFLNAPLNSPLGQLQYIELKTYVASGVVFNGASWDLIYFCDLSTQVAATGPQVIDIGVVAVGDLGPGDPVYNINHNKNIAGDYLVFLSVKSNNPNTHFKNNQVALAWHHSLNNKANQFHISAQEITGEQQDMSIAWVIIKI